MKGRPIITEEATPAIIMIARGGLLALALLSAFLCWQGLRADFSWQAYHALVEEIGAGRREPEDAARIAPLLAQPDGAGFRSDPRAPRSKAILQAYDVDLTAQAQGLLPLAPSDNPDMIAARKAARQQIRIALSWTPMDGDLWLRLAVISRTLELPAAHISRLLLWSERTMPHEGWVARRRTALFPEHDSHS